MREVYIGVDPGSKGFAAFLFREEVRWLFVPLADTDVLRDELARISAQHADCFAVVEDVHAIHGQGASSMFKFGFNVGTVVGMLTQAKIPFAYVPPKKWQKEIWETKDRVGNDTKRTSYNAARRLLPDINFRRTERCQKPDDNMVDAALICLYAKRKGL